MPARPMKIGEFADVVGVSIDAIRFYERRGVLRPAPRTAGGYRTFVQRDLDRVRLARQLQKLGLTIDEGSMRSPPTRATEQPVRPSAGDSSRSRLGLTLR
jgi:hypothetical protein